MPMLLVRNHKIPEQPLTGDDYFIFSHALLGAEDLECWSGIWRVSNWFYSQYSENAFFVQATCLAPGLELEPGGGPVEVQIARKT